MTKLSTWARTNLVKVGDFLPINLGLGKVCPAVDVVASGQEIDSGINILGGQANIVEGIILPQIPEDEAAGFLEAISAFEDAAFDYFVDIDPTNPLKPIDIGWQNRHRIQQVLSRPGFQAALGICGSCLATAVTGHLVPYEIGARIFSTAMVAIPPTDAPKEGLLRYMAVSPDLRTHFTNLMIRLEQAMRRLDRLTPDDLSWFVMKQLASPELMPFLKLAFIDLKDLLFEHDTLTILLYNTIQNILFGGDRDVSIYRVHFNMTTINEMDSTNHHGNVYLRVIQAWFQEKFGTIHVVRNPERTSFEFIARPARHVRQVMNSFEIEVQHRIATATGVDPAIVAEFIPRAVLSRRTLTRRNLYRYGVRSSADIVMFREVLEFSGRVDVDALAELPEEQQLRAVHRVRPDIDGIVKTGDKRLIKTLYAVMIKGISTP